MKPIIIVVIVVCIFLTIIGVVLGVYFSGVACPDFGSECPSPSPSGTPPSGTPPSGTPPSDGYRPCTGYFEDQGDCSATTCGTQGCRTSTYVIPAGSGTCPYAQGTSRADANMGCVVCRAPECPTASGCVKTISNQCGITCVPPEEWGWQGNQYGWGCAVNY